MKKRLLLQTILFFLFATMVKAQDNPIEEKINIEEYKTDSVRCDFRKEFSSADDKINFKKLRNYLQQKQSLQEQLQVELANYADIKRNLDLMVLKSGQIDEAIKIAKASDPKEASVDIYLPNCNINVYGSSKLTIDELNALKKQIAECQATEKKRQQEFDILKYNLKVIKMDLGSCQDQLDSTLAPEYHDQEFRKDISIGFAILLGTLLLIFVVVIVRSEKNIADYFFSDTGLQFITIFVLIIAIILFGILGILEAKELAAILAGISGYILGKTRAPVVQNPAPVSNNPGQGNTATTNPTMTNNNSGTNSNTPPTDNPTVV
jgi:hypothetical protein